MCRRGVHPEPDHHNGRANDHHHDPDHYDDPADNDNDNDYAAAAPVHHAAPGEDRAPLSERLGAESGQLHTAPR